VPLLGRRRPVNPVPQFGPTPDCPYRGWVGWGNLRAHGPPGGGRWRPLRCLGWRSSLLETLGTVFHGQRVAPELLGRGSACVADGLGMRGTARVFEVDPHTVRPWVVAAGDQLGVWSASFRHALHLRQGQRDELYAVLSAVTAGKGSEDEALDRLERSPHWVWTALEPESKVLLALAGGARPLALAQRVVHHGAPLVAPDRAPLFVTAGVRAYLPALLPPYGQGGKPLGSAHL
jgi:hypothetical protein